MYINKILQTFFWFDVKKKNFKMTMTPLTSIDEKVTTWKKNFN